MANPIHFTPKRVDPHKELQRRLQAAPEQHAEALLVLFDVIEEAHDQGLLDLLHGAVGSKNAIAAKLAYYALMSLMTDAESLTLAQMQWMGECLTQWKINSEIGSLAGEVPQGGKMFRFARYDVKLEVDSLRDELDVKVSP